MRTLSATYRERLLKQVEAGLRSGRFTVEDVEHFLLHPSLWATTDASRPPLSIEALRKQAQGFLPALGFSDSVPECPNLSVQQLEQLGRYGFTLLYIPQVGSGDLASVERLLPNGVAPGPLVYPEEMESIPLSSGWVAVEMINRPNQDDPVGYPEDRLMIALGRRTRLHTSWMDVMGFSKQSSQTARLLTGFDPRPPARSFLRDQIAEHLGFSRESVVLPSLEEWLFCAGFFNGVQKLFCSLFPDLLTPTLLEWCRNAYGSQHHVQAGGTDADGVVRYSRSFTDYSGICSGFRFLIRLS